MAMTLKKYFLFLSVLLFTGSGLLRADTHRSGHAEKKLHGTVSGVIRYHRIFTLGTTIPGVAGGNDELIATENEIEEDELVFCRSYTSNGTIPVFQGYASLHTGSNYRSILAFDQYFSYRHLVLQVYRV